MRKYQLGWLPAGQGGAFTYPTPFTTAGSVHLLALHLHCPLPSPANTDQFHSPSLARSLSPTRAQKPKAPRPVGHRTQSQQRRAARPRTGLRHRPCPERGPLLSQRWLPPALPSSLKLAGLIWEQLGCWVAAGGEAPGAALRWEPLAGALCTDPGLEPNSADGPWTARQSVCPLPNPGRQSRGTHAMLAAWRARCSHPTRRREAESRLREARDTDRCLCRLLLPPHWKGGLDPNRRNPQRSTGSSGTFAIRRFYWLRKGFSLIQKLGCLIKYAFFCSRFAHIRCHFPALPSPPFRNRSFASVSIQGHQKDVSIYI